MWLEHIYGNPSLVSRVFEGPLGTLVQRLPESHIEVFNHPVISTAVDLKWRRFGRRKLISVALQQILCLISYLVVGVSQGMNMHTGIGACALWGVITAYHILRICHMAIWETCSQRMQVVDLRLITLHIPQSVCLFFVQLRFVCCILSLMLIWQMLKPCFEGATENCPAVGEGVSRILYAFVAFLQWIQLAEMFKLHSKLAAVVLLGKAMLQDAARFMMGLLLWLIAVGAALDKLTSSTMSSHDAFNFKSAYSLFALALGVGEDSDLTFYTGSFEAVVKALFLSALWVSMIPITNLLIAAVVSIYAKAEAMTIALAMKTRADFALRVEDALPSETRLAYFNHLNFQEPLPFSKYEKGPSGGLSNLCNPVDLKHPSYARRTDAVLFFPGDTGPDLPWPAHEVPLIATGSSTSATARAMASVPESHSPSDFHHAPAMQLEPAAVKAMARALGPEHCVLVVEGRIYYVGKFQAHHPGGKAILAAENGSDVSDLFRVSHANVHRARAALKDLPVLGTVSSAELLK